jgi:hypothetical protein
VPEPTRPNAMKDQDLEKGKGCRVEGSTSVRPQGTIGPRG